MRRSDALAELSRDHHHGLVVARELTRAESGAGVAAARERFLEFWSTEGERHFEIEESVLLPRAEPHIPLRHDAVARVLADHERIRDSAHDLAARSDITVAELNDLGTLLERHIRHEERVLFPLIEEALSEAELSELLEALSEAEGSDT